MSNWPENISQEINEYIVDAAYNYADILCIYLQNTQTVFDTEITRAIMAWDNATTYDWWQCYVDLIKVAKIRGVDLMELPKKCFGQAYF